MNCPHCDIEMNIENVQVQKTTTPEEDDQFELLNVCPKCGWIDELGDEKDEYDPDADIDSTLE